MKRRWVIRGLAQVFWMALGVTTVLWAGEAAPAPAAAPAPEAAKPAGPEAKKAEAVKAALAKWAAHPDDVFQGKTQEELAKEVPASVAFNSDETVKAETVTLSEVVDGKTEDVEAGTIYRYLTGVERLQYRGNVIWTCIAGFLVFLMQAGFACVEAGLTRAKNTVNICMKNMLDFCFGSIAYIAIGFHIMFAGDTPLFFLGAVGDHAGVEWGWSFWFFQCVFAATTATIVSGAMAERTKFSAYLVYSIVISAVIYPVYGRWAWANLLDGHAWLGQDVGFYDFAGTTVVHSIGGWCALAGAIVLGPRIGKYGPDGKPRALPGHNFLMVTLGALILWFGWFGFNPGSTTTFDGHMARIAVITNIAGACGGVVALIYSWLIAGKPDASMTVNGFLAGMVAICTGVNDVTVLGGMAIGGVAGIIVVSSVYFIDRVLKIDDPVGAVSVHGVSGAWGTISYAFFRTGGFDLGVLKAQVIGVGMAFIWAFGTAMVLFLAIKYTMGLRVSREEELRGLDLGEHGLEAYHGFQVFSNI